MIELYVPQLPFAYVPHSSPPWHSVPSRVPFAGHTVVVVVVAAGLTVTVRVAPVAIQPVVVPVTVYVVVELGETVIEEVVAPVFQEYELEPLAVKVVD
jgi:hypothetical protein